MKALHNMKEVREFIAGFKEGNIWMFRDSRISMPNGGATEIRMKGGEFYGFSSGENWRDQQEEPIPDIASFVWKNRADIKSGTWL